MTLQERMPATVDSVAAARTAVRRFASGLEVDVDGMVLAVSEAVANVVAHAYDEGAEGSLELTATAAPFEVAVTVRDHGRGLRNGRTASDGFGIAIIRRLAQHVAVDDSDGGVVLTMRFLRGGPWSAR